VRGSLGASLYPRATPGAERQRSWELLRQAVALLRQALRVVPPGRRTLAAQLELANELFNLGYCLGKPGPDGVVEGETSLREALALSEGLGDVWLTAKTLRELVNLCGVEHAAVGFTPTEAEAFRLRRNQLSIQMGRSPETSCSICLDALAPPANGAADDAAGGGGSSGAGGSEDSCVCVLNCNHQFHRGCLLKWRRTTSNLACPLCKE